MRYPRVILCLSTLGLAFSTVPVQAMSQQPAPRNTDGSSQLVDPDEQAERMADQTQRTNQRFYARDALSSSGLVALPASRATGPTNGMPLPRLGMPH